MNQLCCPHCHEDLDRNISCSCGASFPQKNGITQFVEKTLESSYSIEQIERLKQIEKTHFWFRARRLLLIQLLKRYLKSSQRSVLDVGCGTGENLAAICQAGFNGIGIDLQSVGLEMRKREMPFLSMYQASGDALPFPNHSFDAIILADVLEHTDQNQVLSEMDRVLTPSGIAIIMVPAYQWLWSKRDRNAKHVKRYKKRDFIEIAKQNSWQIEFLGGYQCVLLPLVFLSRLLKVSPKVEETTFFGINQLFYGINALEVRSGIQWPFGSSLVGVMRK